MCRNIRLLHHLAPPATEAEIDASALQYVRKLSGIREPSEHNRKAFERAVRQVAAATRTLFDALEPPRGPPRTREQEALKARARGQKREAALARRLAAPRPSGA